MSEELLTRLSVGWGTPLESNSTGLTSYVHRKNSPKVELYGFIILCWTKIESFVKVNLRHASIRSSSSSLSPIAARKSGREWYLHTCKPP